ncbi:MAG: protein-methionine-sulfoxide reductase catalytic subunit MsrP [Magnetospirillum sp.]|nr:protein-methionine-sulfoxide reductase catalytic subunit MsrP [Magnetospirillum sp.]
MLIRTAADLADHDVTDERLYLDRRRFLAAGAATAVLAAGPAGAVPVSGYTPNAVTLDDKPTPFEAATAYNNFYEFGADKEDPGKTAPGIFRTTPWSVTVEGACAKPGTVAVEDLIKPHRLEERLTRLRCVEGWSMVIPWIGVPLAGILQRFEPTSQAKFVAFTTLYDPTRMPGQKRPILDWPYVEGLRIDEAMHPLTLLAVGCYGRELPAQNGAPLRLVVPWKYGFKSIKSIVAISFVADMPVSSWMKAAPREYGFYSNVNPEVDHPRWSQASERRIGEFRRRQTLPFNGYADQVASLYQGMDLKKWF